MIEAPDSFDLIEDPDENGNSVVYTGDSYNKVTTWAERHGYRF